MRNPGVEPGSQEPESCVLSITLTARTTSLYLIVLVIPSRLVGQSGRECFPKTYPLAFVRPY